ncbi:MAG: fumarylacetoacetate hydrolase family protein [Candidatus Carbobacillus sp.]|nr:fumarylacetoacetate hydrolase family protein [Candidatus Carbobacillus sp.]
MHKGMNVGHKHTHMTQRPDEKDEPFARATLRLWGAPFVERALVNPETQSIRWETQSISLADVRPLVPLEHGKDVYGLVFGFQSMWEAYAADMHQAPYQRPPEKPVLFIKPETTWMPYGARIPLAEDVQEVMIRPTIGLVFGIDFPASPFGQEEDLDDQAIFATVSGVLPAVDLSLPQSSLYRPPFASMSRDGFLPFGPWAIETYEQISLASLQTIHYTVSINGLKAHEGVEYLRLPIINMLRQIRTFMTLKAGDVLLLGVPLEAPRARLGDRVEVELHGLGPVKFTLVSRSQLFEPERRSMHAP